MININKPINLSGAENFRELGGYPTRDGKTTKNGIYLRGDKTSDLTKEDIQKLLDYNLKLEIDLRSDLEIDREPSVLKNIKEINYINISMLDGMGTMKDTNKMPGSLFEGYVDLLENNKDKYLEIFRLFLDNSETSLFHCSVGKDRTGVLAFLILGLANVSDEIIIEDYAASEIYLDKVINAYSDIYVEELDITIPKYILGSNRENMVKTIDFIKNNYGSVRKYLLSIGLNNDELDMLNNRFVE